MGVDLRRRYRGVPKHLLHCAQVCPAVEEMCSHGMSQPMRSDLSSGARRRCQLVHHAPGNAWVEGSAPRSQKQGVRALRCCDLAAHLQPRDDGPHRRHTHRHQALFRALAHDPDGAVFQGHVADLDTRELGDAKPARVEQLDDGLVACREWIVALAEPGLGAFHHVVDLGVREHLRESA